MAENHRISILLADEDSLRRDGLAAVLQGNSEFEIISQCQDGESALERIRGLHPDVAVVDLNLPRVHGIELVRRVRGEGLGTRIVIMSGTQDDDIVREVVRAGADGYLLKNGPARHLIDAIIYVRDGGQYFSPQLRRDGLDRRLLEEPPRTPPAPPADRHDPGRSRDDSGADDRDYRGDAYDDRDDDHRSSRPSRSRYAGSSRSTARPPARRTADPQRFRERLREEGPQNLGDRDYEILSLMADGIKPILDRLDEIEGRVVSMESGDAPLPNDPRTWLAGQMADTFQSSPGSAVGLGRSVQDIEARLPKLIEDAVTARFNQMAGKLQEEIEETHIRTLETFVKNIQTKLVQRVVALETDMVKHAEAVQQLRDYSQRTEDNLGRLISGVDRLAAELPGRLAGQPLLPPPEAPPARKYRPVDRTRNEFSLSPKVVWPIVLVMILVIGGLVTLSRQNRAKRAGGGPASAQTIPAPQAAQSPVPATAPAAGDTATKLQAAQDASDRKDYQKAEATYREIISTEPHNIEALKGLASVLYREDKIEESAAILDKLPR